MEQAKLNGLTHPEQIAAEHLRARGFTLLRSGWPDFMCATKNGRWVAVEVKGPGDETRPNQDAMHAALARAGVKIRILRVTEDGLSLIHI